jgi:hypothetical protein
MVSLFPAAARGRVEVRETVMSILLTDEQTPVRVIDPENREYVLLCAENYERLRGALKVEEVDPSFYGFEEPDPG